ncbi:phenylacetate-CoA oxygenase/reductase subunit PaaK [Erwinia sp. E602]|uniref:1,2-phenylacetyl-CoA epoxidase subunit PaaE n=1 Tax=Erwinia sp. E602 TaxID=2675378 RepID=UPI001BAD36C4|nr:1,2-phenylacetyl-CoA epoxidase subunit PaaE [Erwinia sp. E602]QUG75003.1 phenylacetate-CoA oxygenase/reductase subunit PaaK [Erwinia sp. E602]
MSQFHHLTVEAIERQTADAVAITFSLPPGAAEIWRFTPGQHLTLRARVDGEDLRRCYSISSAPEDNRLQIGVRAVPGGRFSQHLHRHLHPGDTLDVMPPQGQFGYRPRPGHQGDYLALAAGSGITPLLAIISSTLQQEPDSRFTLVYANRHTQSAMFRQTLADLKDRFLQRLQLFWLFSQESSDSPLLSGHIDAGYLAQLHALIGLNHFQQAFICGPTAMMDNAQSALRQAGIAAQNIHREQFDAGHQHPLPIRTSRDQRCDVEILHDGRRQKIALQPQDRSILDAALRQGIDLPFACKGGVCATCKCRLKSGDVTMEVNYSLEQDQLNAGYILSCQAWPKGDGVVLDFDV